MTRRQFQILADARLRDAEVLLGNRRFAGAYYLAGYSVECAIKACIAKRTRKSEFPPREAPKFYTHDLWALLKMSGLSDQYGEARRDNPDLGSNWSVVDAWSEDSRYETHTQREATELLNAVSDSDNGVLPWLKRYW